MYVEKQFDNVILELYQSADIENRATQVTTFNQVVRMLHISYTHCYGLRKLVWPACTVSESLRVVWGEHNGQTLHKWIVDVIND